MRYLSILAAIGLIFISAIAYGGQFNSGSTGVDGEFNPTINTELQLPANGIFNFTTVNIPAGITVTFKKNAANTPAYILATGDVTIAGSINISGTDGVSMMPGLGGIGGFDGGYGGTVGVSGSKGMGPGGGYPATNTAYAGGGGGFGVPGNGVSYGGAGGSTYGNAKLIPLIGGSGGGGGAGSTPSYSYLGGSGGGGGGAILIASSGTITLTGSITANGGKGVSKSGLPTGAGGGGSGGAIKLMANTLAGNGTISATGGLGGCYSIYFPTCGNGGDGRVRVEVNTIASNRTSGSTPGFTFSYPGPVFVANIPNLQITSIAGVNVPASPTGSYAAPDISLPSTTTNPITVALSASNIPVGTTTTVSIIPQFGSATDSVSSPLSGTLAASTAAASVTLANTYPYVITATATFTIQTAMFFDGEKLDKVRVASTMGKGSEVTYITETGKEIPAEKLMASLMK